MLVPERKLKFVNRKKSLQYSIRTLQARAKKSFVLVLRQKHIEYDCWAHQKLSWYTGRPLPNSKHTSSNFTSELANMINTCGCLTKNCIETMLKTKAQGCKAKSVGWVLKQCDKETVRRG